MPRLRDYRWFQENYPVDIPRADIQHPRYAEEGIIEPRMEIDLPSGAGYAGAPPSSPEETALIGQLMRGKPPEFFGDPEGRAEMEELGITLQKEQEAHQAEIEQLAPEQRAYYEKTLAERRKPPEGYQAPDFSDAGRHRYEQGVFREIQKLFRIPGGNPFKINPMDAVDEAMATQLPQLFEQVFGGRILFSDASKLEGKAQKYWNDTVLRFKAEVSKKAETALQRAEAYHEYAMSKYDTQRSTHKGKLEQIRKEALKPPDMKLMVNDKGEQTWHEWNENSQTWVDTGKLKTPEKEEKPEKPEYKPGQALEKIATAQRAKATFNRTKTVDLAMAELFPEFKALVGKRLSPKQIKTVNKSYNRLIKYLEKFGPEVNKRDQAIEQLQNAGQQVTEANIKYVMDQL